MCDGGVVTWNRSASVSPSASTQCRVATRSDRCVCLTALGIPVVPELKTRTASASGEHLHTVGRLVRHGDGIDVGDGQHLPEDGHRRPVRHAVHRFREADGVLDLGRLPGRTDEHDRGAQVMDGVHGDDELRAVREHHGDAVAVGDARVGEEVGERTGPPVDLDEGQVGVAGAEEDPISVRTEIAEPRPLTHLPDPTRRWHWVPRPRGPHPISRGR